MIINAILLIVQAIIELLLLPLTALNVGIDLLASIPVVGQFLQVVFYILPMSNIMPLIGFVIAYVVFRINLALFKEVIKLIPIVGH